MISCNHNKLLRLLPPPRPHLTARPPSVSSTLGRPPHPPSSSTLLVHPPRSPYVASPSLPRGGFLLMPYHAVLLQLSVLPTVKELYVWAAFCFAPRLLGGRRLPYHAVLLQLSVPSKAGRLCELLLGSLAVGRKRTEPSCSFAAAFCLLLGCLSWMGCRSLSRCCRSVKALVFSEELLQISTHFNGLRCWVIGAN